MSKFRVGDKVKCIDPIDELEVDSVYIIKSVSDGYVYLVESKMPRAFWPFRFQLVENKEKTISVSDMVAAIKPQLPELAPAEKHFVFSLKLSSEDGQQHSQVDHHSCTREEIFKLVEKALVQYE